MAEFSGHDLVCVRGERTVFTGVSFSLGARGALVLTGANGSGKSSLLRLMAGLLAPAAGHLAWDGTDVSLDPDAHHRRLRWIGHADAVKPALSVVENLRTWASLWGGRAHAEARSRAALDAFGIARLADVPGRYLSAGQRRRLALARLLVAPATLWLLDEPRTALDAEAAMRLDDAITRHREAGGMVVLALHGDDRPAGCQTLDLSGAPGSTPGSATGC